MNTIDTIDAPIAYGWDVESFEFAGAVPCQPDPLESAAQGEPVWLVPGRSTLIPPLNPERDAPARTDHDAQGAEQPPAHPVRYVNVWGGNAWALHEDHRGAEYWLPGDDHYAVPRIMDALGPLPEGAQLMRPKKTQAEMVAEVRSLRDYRIAATDYLMAVDYPLTGSQRTAWAAYRQALRDLPQAVGFPWDGGGAQTPWPERPN